MNPIIRLATNKDIDEIMEIVHDAKELLRQSGSMQWNGKDGYPTKQTFLDDINNGICYVADNNSSLLGVMAVCFEKDESYEAKKDIWQYETYYSVHRIALRKTAYHKGISTLLMNYAEQLAIHNKIESLRVDTHEMNKPMQALLSKLNYSYRGVIELVRVQEDNRRLAFEKHCGKEG